MIDGRLLFPIPDLVVPFNELTGGIFLENNPTGKCAITCGINNTMCFKRTEVAYGRPSGQMQFETRQTSEDGGFCLFIVKNSRNSDTFASWRTFVASRIAKMDVRTSLSSNTSHSSDACFFPKLSTFRDKLEMASTTFCSITFFWLFVDVVA